jgi:hypothetical protein
MKESQIAAVYNHENPEMLRMGSMMGEFAVSSLVDNIILMNWIELGDSFRLGFTIAKLRANPVDRITRECEIINGQGLRVLPRTLPVPQHPFSSYAGLVSRAPVRRLRTLGGLRMASPSPTHNLLFQPELWERALESYAKTVGLTVKLYDTDARVILGPIHATPLFQLFQEAAEPDPGIFAECARRCLAQTTSRAPVLVGEFHGLTVVGTSLALSNQIVACAVGAMPSPISLNFPKFSVWRRMWVSGLAGFGRWRASRGRSLSAS